MKLHPMVVAMAILAGITINESHPAAAAPSTGIKYRPFTLVQYYKYRTAPYYYSRPYLYTYPPRPYRPALHYRYPRSYYYPPLYYFRGGGPRYRY
jgi:hypothetical protein